MSIGTTSPYRDDESSSATLVDLARMHIERSPKAGQQRVSRETVLRLLQESLTEELACVQRCKRHHYAYMELATRLGTKALEEECLGHAADEQSHVDKLVERICQLGGEPNLSEQSSAGLRSSQLGDPLAMIHADIAAERIVIDAYTEILRYLGDEDPDTSYLFEAILGAEYRHVEDLNRLLSTRCA